jgi:hypothetical protein
MGLRFFALSAALLLTILWIRAEAPSLRRALLRDFSFAPEPIAAALTVLLAAALAGAACLWDWSNGGAGELTVMGSLPLSDAHGYWDCATELAATGRFLAGSDWCARRMLYPSFLAGLLSVSGWRFPLALLFQTAIVALAIGALARETARLAGLLGALMALWLMGAYAWTYAFGTTMTEPLGLTLAAAGLALALRGVRTRQPLSAYLGVAAIGLGMAARPGAVFTLPLVVLWAYWSGPSWGHRRWVAGALGAVALGIGPAIQRALVSLQGLSIQPFGNFSATLYGLSKGGTGWDSAYSDNPELFRGMPEAQAFKRIYDLALANLREEPALLLHAFGKNLALALHQATGSLAGDLWVAAAATGLILCLMGRWGARGALVAAGIVGLLLSIPAVFGDGSIRIFAVTVPFAAAAVALGATAWVAWAVSGGRWAANRNDANADHAGERAGPLDAGLALAVPLLIVLVPYSPLAALAKLPVATGETCNPGEQVLVVRPGRETIGLVIAAKHSDAAAPPRSAPRELVLNDIQGIWYERDFRPITTDTILLHAVQRGSEGYGRTLSVFLSSAGWAMDGRLHTLCIDPARRLRVGASDFAGATDPITRPVDTPVPKASGEP